MRIVLISDTHSLERFMHPLPEGDVLIHAGDLTNEGSTLDVKRFAEWSKTLPYYQKKIIIAGNHDFCFERRDISTITAIDYLKDADWTYLKDSSDNIIDMNDGRVFKVYGSPWQPEFHNWAFNLPRGERLRRIWENIPDDTDILVTHGPPHGILDYTEYQELHVGCEELLKRIQSLKNLKLHVFGHIHETYGTQVENGVTFANASICTLQYKPTNLPIIIDL